MSQTTNPPVYLFTCTTGTAGNVGGNSLRSFLSNPPSTPHKIRIGARSPAKALNAFKGYDNIEAAHLDLGDSSAYENALKDVVSVFLGAPDVGGMDSTELLEAFVDAVEKEQKRSGQKIRVVRFVGGGLSEEDLKIAREVGTTFLEGHRKACEVFGKARKEGKMDVVIVDAQSWFFQNYTSLALKMIKKGTVAVLNGDVALPYIDTREIGDVVAKVMVDKESGGKDVVLTGAVKMTTSEWTKMIAGATGRNLKSSTDEKVCEDFYKEIEEQFGPDGVTDFKKFFKFEEACGKLDVELHPETFEGITGKKHRTPQEFCKEMAATKVWDE